MVYSLTGQAASPTAGEDGNAVFPGNFHSCGNFVFIPGPGDPDWDHLINTGIGAVQQAGEMVKSQVLKMGSKVILEIFDRLVGKF